MNVQELIVYINSHLQDELRLVDVAKLAGYSPWYLYELFKEYTNKPIMQYIREKRIKSASEELLRDYRLYDVAMNYGFETQAGFYKAFINYIGCAPLEYKKHKLREKYCGNISKIENMKIGDAFMEKLIIRKVKQSDAKDLWENIFSRNTPAEVEERIAGNIRKMDCGEVMNWVAEVDGVVIGNILLVRENHDLKMHRCSLGDVVVNPVFRGMGIAQKLFDECKIHAKDNGFKIITVNCRGNTPAETVYMNLGFIEAGRIPNGILENWGDNNCFDDVFFYLPL